MKSMSLMTLNRSSS